jgi:hypothetical protein
MLNAKSNDRQKTKLLTERIEDWGEVGLCHLPHSTYLKFNGCCRQKANVGEYNADWSLGSKTPSGWRVQQSGCRKPSFNPDNSLPLNGHSPEDIESG